MAQFLLIHGACHGAWAWRDTIPALQALGHKARAIDLPSHGADTTPAGDVTLDTYARAILDALTEPTVVVGHSMGGFPITRAAQLDASNIKALAYVCAYTPWPGFTLADMRRLSDHQPLVPAIRKAPDGMTMTFDPAMAPALFYHDCSDEQRDFALANICAQPIAPMETALDDSALPPRSYILCNDDRAIPPTLQRRMADKLPPQDVFTLDSSHSPFFAHPEELAQTLHLISEKYT